MNYKRWWLQTQTILSEPGATKKRRPLLCYDLAPENLI